VTRLLTGTAAPPYDDGTRWVGWSPTAPIAPDALEGADAVVHLAGDNVASGRWSAAKKRQILESRTVPTRAVARSLAALPAARRPKVLVSASAVGFYGTRGDAELTEDSPAGTGYFPDVSKAWEDACAPARDAGIRVVNLRLGVVLTPKGGALGKQLFAFKAGGGATLGSGTQWTPWVTIGDVVGAIHHALMTDALSGPVNAVGPNPVTNRTFTKALGRVLSRPALLWLPRPALLAMFGELADAALLASTRAKPAKLLATGFAFDHPDLEPALRFLLGR
ncbi:MAG: TIGR01777 family oxidoreductase, partial [Gemmata sp.]